MLKTSEKNVLNLEFLHLPLLEVYYVVIKYIGLKYIRFTKKVY